MGISGAQTSIDPSYLEAFVRDELNANAKRTMAVLEPIKVRILNLPADKKDIKLEIADFPNAPERGMHEISFDEVLYIEANDFREANAEKGYRRLTPEQQVGLRYANFVIGVVDVIKENDQVVEIQVNATPIDQVEKRPKAFIHWVAKPVECEVRLYERLFKHANPEDKAEVPGGFLSDCNTDTLKVINNALLDQSILGSRIYDKFQFERVGYFSIDPESSENRFVFNRTVLLNEDKKKNA